MIDCSVTDLARKAEQLYRKRQMRSGTIKQFSIGSTPPLSLPVMPDIISLRIAVCNGNFTAELPLLDLCWH